MAKIDRRVLIGELDMPSRKGRRGEEEQGPENSSCPNSVIQKFAMGAGPSTAKKR